NNAFHIISKKLVDNPDERIVDDTESFTSDLQSNVFNLLVILFSVAGIAATDARGVNRTPIIIVFVPLTILAIIFGLIESHYIYKLTYSVDNAEGSWRYTHAILRANSESISFFKCEERFLLLLQQDYSTVLNLQLQFARWDGLGF